jgi:Tfp pilus assembly protein PilO
MKLTKREIIMLTFLIIIALFFVEYRLILSPSLARLTALSEKEASLENEYQTIYFNLTMAKKLEKTIEENLATIDGLSEPFLSGVAPDALLVFTHEMMLKHGFSPQNYSPMPNASELLQPTQVEISDLSYRLKEIAVAYRQLKGKMPAQPDEDDAELSKDDADDDIIEVYTIQVDAVAGYEQIRALIDNFHSLGRHITITNMSMTPAQQEEQDGDTGESLLNVAFAINYYGIEKLVEGQDPLNAWMRKALVSTTENPFVTPPSPGA